MNQTSNHRHHPIIIIPARLHSVRLPNKPLADINGRAMILHCMDRALEADIAPVLIAAADPEIVDLVTDAGGNAILTDPQLPSGSDRVFAALEAYDPKRRHDLILNLQGDLPGLPPEYLIRLRDILIQDSKCDISSLASPMDYEQAQNPNFVKAIAGLTNIGDQAYSIGFTRAVAPWAQSMHDQSYLHHIGLYGWRRDALERFVALPPSMLEQRERLEQLRALEAGMRLKLELVATCPAGVDTQAELALARLALAPKKRYS
ncbi:MAG: 3-deoxy-manno-octulosonate cytidylyltransferase [Alphaproteobacteria bacterium]